MPTFKMGVTVGDINHVVSAALGASTAEKFATAADKGKPVKLGGDSRYVLCALNDKPEGFIESVDGATVNGGYSFGSVQTNGRIEAVITTAYAIGDLVSAVAPAAAGTAETVVGKPRLQKPGTAPTGNFLWRVVSGSGTINTVAVIERVA